MGEPKGAFSEWNWGALNGGGMAVNDRKEKSGNRLLGDGGRWGIGGWHETGGTDLDGLNFTGISADREGFAVEAKIESTSIADAEEDAFYRAEGAFVAGLEGLRIKVLAVDGDRKPALIAGLNSDDEFAGGGYGGCFRCFWRRRGGWG